MLGVTVNDKDASVDFDNWSITFDKETETIHLRYFVDLNVVSWLKLTPVEFVELCTEREKE